MLAIRESVHVMTPVPLYLIYLPITYSNHRFSTMQELVGIPTRHKMPSLTMQFTQLLCFQAAYLHRHSESSRPSF